MSLVFERAMSSSGRFRPHWNVTRAVCAAIAVAGVLPRANGANTPEVIDYSVAEEGYDYSSVVTPLTVVFEAGNNAGFVNISGATLFADYTENPASSNDWSNPDCDFDCNVTASSCVDGLTGDDCDPASGACAYRGFNPDRIFDCGMNEVDVLSRSAVSNPLNTFWVVNYRGVGSTNGVQEFVDNQVSFLNSMENASAGENSDLTCPGILDDAGCPAECTTDIANALFDPATGACSASGQCGAKCEASCVCNALGLDPAICDLEILRPDLLGNPANPNDDQPNPDYNEENIFTIAQAIAQSFGCADPTCYFAPVVYPLDKPSENSNINQVRYHQGSSGACSGPWTIDPLAPSSCAFVAMTSVDIASTDVPTKWAIQAGVDANAQWNNTPTSDGYGRNAITSWDTGFSNRLKNLFFDFNRNGTIEDSERLNTNAASPDCRTVFDTRVAHSVVSFITNRGTGIENVDETDLQHHVVTGRFISGLNLAAATRDSGSGTRNIAMNGICVDPSFGRGENRGDKQKTAANTNLGPGTQRSNLGGSSVMENVVQNHRLALGYTGLAGGSRSTADTSAGKYEIVNLRNDYAGTAAAIHVRPGKLTAMKNDNPDDSYRVAGEQTFATRGDPNANRLSTDPQFVNNPPVFDDAAAAFLNNIKDSQRDFDPFFPADTFLMPGQDLARRFITPAGVARLPNPVDPCDYQATPGFNQSLQDFMISNLDLGSGVGAPWFGNPPPFGAVSDAGRIPVRKANPDFPPTGGNDGEDVYSDGNTAPGYCYFDLAGNPHTAASGDLSQANARAADFDVNGDVDLNDVPGMVSATFAPRAWQLSGAADGSGTNGNMVFDMAIPEVIGDYNGDGNLDKEDWRYFADGLYIAPVACSQDSDCATHVSCCTAVDASNPFCNQTGDVGFCESGALNREAASVAIDDAILAYAPAHLGGASEAWLPWALDAGSRWPTPAASPCQDSTPTIPSVSVASMLVTGAAYASGDFRGDVAGVPDANGNWATAPGAEPIGADGLIDINDINYCSGNLGAWDDLSQAVHIDLSCDMNGDLSVDGGDICVLVKGILKTSIGDLDLDGTATCTDYANLQFGGEATWANGDLNSDGTIDQCDEKVMLRGIALEVANVDATNSTIDIDDIMCVLDDIAGSAGPNCGNADIFPPCSGGDSVTNLFDLLQVLDAFSNWADAACPNPCGAPAMAPEIGHNVVSLTDANAHGELFLVARDRSVAPGQPFEIDVYAKNIGDLRGYQIGLSVDTIRGGGTIELTDIAIDEARKGYVFHGQSSYVSTDVVGRRTANVVDGAGVKTAKGYLATFTYEASQDASGFVRIAVDPAATKLRDSRSNAMTVHSVAASVVRIGGRPSALIAR